MQSPVGMFGCWLFRRPASLAISAVRLHLRTIIEKKTGILPTIVVTEIVRYVSDKRGREEATIRYLSLKRSGLVIAKEAFDFVSSSSERKYSNRNLESMTSKSV